MTDHDTTPGAPGTEARIPSMGGRHPAQCYEDGCVCDLVGPAGIPLPEAQALRILITRTRASSLNSVTVDDEVAKAIIAAGWISPTEAATRDAAQRAALAKAADDDTALFAAIEKVMHGEPNPSTAADKIQDVFVAWLSDTSNDEFQGYERADRIGGASFVCEDESCDLPHAAAAGGVRVHPPSGAVIVAAGDLVYAQCSRCESHDHDASACPESGAQC